jgi:hypothetical protein
MLFQTVERLPPLPGRRIEGRVRLISQDPPVATNAFVVTIAGEQLDLGDHVTTLVCYPIDDVRCPQCHEQKLVMGFHDDDNCPQCGQRALRLSAVMY